ncbi:MAG TPA: Lrp/AsnC family transcriptional regulator [Ktedonobacterales bacterium]
MIDEIDSKILTILQDDARTSNAEIARRLAMAPSAILERIRKLEHRGLIKGYEARLNPKALESGLLAFIFVLADERIGLDDAGQALAQMPEVQEVHHIAGEDCYLVKVRVADTDALGDLLRQRFSAIGSIRSTRTTIVLSTIKETAQISLPSTEKEDLSDAG